MTDRSAEVRPKALGFSGKLFSVREKIANFFTQSRHCGVTKRTQALGVDLSN